MKPLSERMALIICFSVADKATQQKWVDEVRALERRSITEAVPESVINDDFDELLFDLARNDDYAAIWREINRRLAEAAVADAVNKVGGGK